MRRVLGIAAILTGVASASAAETSYKACAIDGRLGFFSFTEVGDFVEIKIVGSAEEPFNRPANSPLLIEVDGEVLVFGDDKATLIQGDELTQLDCFLMYASQVSAFNAGASEIAAELKRQVQILNEQAVDLRRQLGSDLYIENENLKGRLAEALATSADRSLQIGLLNAKVVELRNQIATLQQNLKIADQAKAEAKVQIEVLAAQLNAALEEAKRLRGY